MNASIELHSVNEIMAWYEAFKVLGTKRCQPFLTDMGVPLEIASSPDHLSTAARNFLLADRREHFTFPSVEEYALSNGFTQRDVAEYLAGDSGGAVPSVELARMVRRWSQLRDGADLEVNLSVLQRTFGELESAYGHKPAEELYRWGQRYFVDWWIGRKVWLVWSWILPRLAGAYPAKATSSPELLSPSARSRFEAVVRAHFGSEIEGELEKRIKAAYDIPLSAVEERWTTVAAPDRDGNYPSRIDLLLAVGGVVQHERAYQVWVELYSWMTSQELEALLQWARQEAPAFRIPPDELTLPALG